MTFVAQGGLLTKKQEMTKMRKNGKYEAVTLLYVPFQEVIRHKTQDVDAYDALVIGVEKIDSPKGQKKYKKVYEIRVDKYLLGKYAPGDVLDVSILKEVEAVRVVGTSKGKGFQGVMKRHNFAGGPASHGSKFHRAGGSTGNRKPRRTMKGRKMAGRMGGDRITLKSVPVVEIRKHDNKDYLVLKGSIPGGYHDYVQVLIAK